MEYNLSELVRDLYSYGVIMLGSFKLTSGLESPYYIDLKRIYSNPDLFRRVIDAYIETLGKYGVEFDVVAGVETGGIPIAAVIAYKLSKPMVYVRSRKKSFGTGRVVEGSVEEGARVLVVDDVATTGGSLAHAAESIRGVGGDVVGAIVFVDRLQGAVRRLSELGVRFYSVYRIDEIIEILYGSGLIDRGRYEAILGYIGGGVES